MMLSVQIAIENKKYISGGSDWHAETNNGINFAMTGLEHENYEIFKIRI